MNNIWYFFMWHDRAPTQPHQSGKYFPNCWTRLESDFCFFHSGTERFVFVLKTDHCSSDLIILDTFQNIILFHLSKIVSAFSQITYVIFYRISYVRLWNNFKIYHSNLWNILHWFISWNMLCHFMKYLKYIMLLYVTELQAQPHLSDRYFSKYNFISF